MPGFQTDVPRWARVYADHPDTAVTGGSASQAVPSASCLLLARPSVPASKAYHPSSHRGSTVGAPLLPTLLLCLFDSLEEAAWQAAWKEP